MKLEDQVCSLELAQKLYELGVTQRAAFAWAYTSARPTPFLVLDDNRKDFGDGLGLSATAFTVAELGEMLPHQFYHGERHCVMTIAKANPTQWNVIYRYPFGGGHIQEVGMTATTEADARAKMLIYLLENHLLKVENINQPKS
jgi:hypothetical protein